MASEDEGYTPEERALNVAIELVRDIINREDAVKFYEFNTEEYIATLRVEVFPKSSIMEHGLFMSTLPAGDRCACCNGSGKQKPDAKS